MPILTLDAVTHKYTLDGKAIVGTTELMSCVGARKSVDEPWRSASGAEFIQGGDTAREFGIFLHAIAVLMIQGKKFRYDEKMEPWVQGLRKFFNDHHELKTVTIDGVPAIEMMVWSKLGYAGTFDWFAESPKFFVLIDWKSSVCPQPHWYEQTAAYENAIRERFNIPAGKQIQRWPVMIKPNDYRIMYRKNHPEDWHNFVSMLNVYRAVNK